MNLKDLKNIEWIVLILLLTVVSGIILNKNYPSFTDNSIYIFIKDFITFLLTFAGIFVANKGVFTWRDQIEYSKEKEVSTNLRHSILKLRDAVNHVRNPAIWNAEIDKAIEYFKNKYPDRKNDLDIEKDSNIYVYEMRWEEITKAYTEMEAYLLAAEVLWGTEILSKVKPLKKKITELSISIRQNFNTALRSTDFKTIFNTIYNTSSEDEKDEFSKEIDKYIAEINDYIKSKIVT